MLWGCLIVISILITNFHPISGGGHATYIKSLVCDTPDDLSIEVASPATSLVFSFCAQNMVTCHPVNFPGKLKELLMILRNLIKLRRLVLTKSFDIIHCNGSPDHRLAMLTLLTVRGASKPKVLFTKHNSFPVQNSIFTKWRYISHTDSVITVCSEQEKQIQTVLSGKTPIRTISNGVCLTRFRPVPSKRKAELRSQFEIPHDRLVFVSCAGSSIHKGWQYLTKVAANDASILVIVLGNKPPQNKLEEIFAGEIPNNLWFPGNQDDVRPYLWAADVGFVLSTSVETISFACREMMATGLPALVSDVGCLAQNVDQGCGWVVIPGSSNSIGEVLPIIKRANLEKMQIAARQRAERLFDVQTFRNQTYNVYRNLAPTRPQD